MIYGLRVNFFMINIRFVNRNIFILKIKNGKCLFGDIGEQEGFRWRGSIRLVKSLAGAGIAPQQ